MSNAKMFFESNMELNVVVGRDGLSEKQKLLKSRIIDICNEINLSVSETIAVLALTRTAIVDSPCDVKTK